MRYRQIVAALAAGVVCLAPLAGAAHAAGGAPVSKVSPKLDADTEVNELLFGGAGPDFILASERKFAVTPRTEFFGKGGGKTFLSSIKKGSMVKVVFHREADGTTLTAVSVTVTKDTQ